MKDLKWLSIEDYATSPLELTVVSCNRSIITRQGQKKKHLGQEVQKIR